MKETRSAIKLMILFFILCIIYDIAMLGGRISFTDAPPGDSPWKIYSIFNLIGFIGTIPFLGSIYKFIKDSGNTISKHESNVKKAVSLFMIGSALGIAVRGQTFIFVFKIINHPVHLIFYTVGSVILVKGLTKDFEEKLLYIGAGFHLIAITGLGILLYESQQFQWDLNYVGEVGLLISILVASVIGFILYIIAYNRVNQNYGGKDVLRLDYLKSFK